MRYFYDHQTDVLTISVGNLADYQASEELVPGVTLHVDDGQRPLGAEIHTARLIADTTALRSFEEHSISSEELERRLSKSESGKRVWMVLSSAATGARV